MLRPIRFVLMNITFVLAAVLGGLSLAAVALPAYAVSQPVSPAMLSLARLHIPGMTCANGSCATTIYLTLKRLPGVVSVGVDEASQMVSVRYIPSKTQPVAFLKAVSNAGYPGTLIASKGG